MEGRTQGQSATIQTEGSGGNRQIYFLNWLHTLPECLSRNSGDALFLPQDTIFVSPANVSAEQTRANSGTEERCRRFSVTS